MTVILRYHKSVSHPRIIIPTSDLYIQLFQTIQETYHTTQCLGTKTRRRPYTSDGESQKSPHHQHVES